MCSSPKSSRKNYQIQHHFLCANEPILHTDYYYFFWKREVLLILDNYIKMIQLYKIHPGLCITKMHIAYEKGTKKKRENAMT